MGSQERTFSTTDLLQFISYLCAFERYME